MAGTTGNNYVDLDNVKGTTTLSLGGTLNYVYLNGDATNSITSTGDHTITDVGYVGDHAGKYTTTEVIGGKNDFVYGGDSNFNVVGLGVTTMATVGLGNGANTVLLGGDGHDIVNVGNGANTISTAGIKSQVTVGNGTNSVSFSGDNNKITAGNGANTLTSNGDLNHGSFGTGADTLIENGNNDTFAFTGSTVNATLAGTKESLTLDNTKVGSTVLAQANSDMFDLKDTANGTFNLGGSVTGEAFKFESSYNGASTINLFGPGDTINLANVKQTNGTAFTSFGQVLGDLNSDKSATSETLDLQGGGSITLAANTILSPTEFKFI